MHAEPPGLRVESVGVKLGRFALSGINLESPGGAYHILLGPTGSGKSTLLKCILGLHRIDEGRLFLGDREITVELPENRRMGYVPQNYALFPHMTVEQNVRFGIEARTSRSPDSAAYLEKLLGLMGIEKLRTRRVRNLSGGEQQKVALARALGTRPEIILLDEPSAGMDPEARRFMWRVVG